MGMDVNELLAESSAQLLPGREALNRCSFRIFRGDHVTRHTANVYASNSSTALNLDSDGADAESMAVQSIAIAQ
jgi:hypothetical protein